MERKFQDIRLESINKYSGNYLIGNITSLKSFYKLNYNNNSIIPKKRDLDRHQIGPYSEEEIDYFLKVRKIIYVKLNKLIPISSDSLDQIIELLEKDRILLNTDELYAYIYILINFLKRTIQSQNNIKVFIEDKNFSNIVSEYVNFIKHNLYNIENSNLSNINIYWINGFQNNNYSDSHLLEPLRKSILGYSFFDKQIFPDLKKISYNELDSLPYSDKNFNVILISGHGTEETNGGEDDKVLIKEEWVKIDEILNKICNQENINLIFLFNCYTRKINKNNQNIILFKGGIDLYLYNLISYILFDDICFFLDTEKIKTNLRMYSFLWSNDALEIEF